MFVVFILITYKVCIRSMMYKCMLPFCWSQIRCVVLCLLKLSFKYFTFCTYTMLLYSSKLFSFIYYLLLFFDIYLFQCVIVCFSFDFIIVLFIDCFLFYLLLFNIIYKINTVFTVRMTYKLHCCQQLPPVVNSCPFCI